MALDERVAQAIYRARALERALHDPGPWYIEWDGAYYPADRIVEDDRVTFRGKVGAGVGVEATLMVHGEPFWLIEFGDLTEVSGDELMVVEWSMALSAPARV